MSDLTTTFVGALAVVFVAIRYWRILVGLLAALLLTTVVLGVQQLLSATDRPANVPEQSQVDGTRS
jgi:hypothetical protein